MQSSSTPPLSGFRVLELGWCVATSACGSLLAQMGAEVLVVEPHETNTEGKWRNRSAAMAGKYSVFISGESSEDHKTIDQLIQRVDIVLFSTDTASPFKAWNSTPSDRTIFCNITAFGNEDAITAETNRSEIVEALAGVLDTNGLAGRNPLSCGVDVLEFSAALFASSAILAAIHSRYSEGFGQRIDICLYDTAINALVNYIPLHLTKNTVTRSGNRHPLHTPWGCYKALDGFVMICSVTVQQFERICKAIGQPELAKDQRFFNSGERLKHYTILDSIIQEWVVKMTMNECISILSGHGIACGPVIQIDKLSEDANLILRDSIKKTFDNKSGLVTYLPQPPLRSEDINLIQPLKIPSPNEDMPMMQTWLKIEAHPIANHKSKTPRPLPLAGIRIIEIGQYTVAPLVSRHLGSLGAEVIKIESPDGDATRRSSPLREDGNSIIFALSNTDKRGLVLDLNRKDHQEALHKLLAASDALVENLKPGSLSKMGFSQQVLKERHPHLVYCPINGFGIKSAYPGRPALDTVIQAMSGIMDLMRVDGMPLKTGISTSDTIGGQVGLVAILAGLLHRNKTGIAPHFDISMQDASMWITQMDWTGSHPKKKTTIVEAKDGHVYVQTTRMAIQSLGLELVKHSRDEIVALLKSFKINAYPVLTVSEVLNSERVKQHKLLIERFSCDGLKWLVLGSPMQLQETMPQIKSVMGPLGIQDDLIINEFNLGIKAELLQ